VFTPPMAPTTQSLFRPRPVHGGTDWRGLAEWLCNEVGGDTSTIVGIDHGFSFPVAYFDRHRLPLNWPNFLLDFQRHWPTHEPNTYVDFIRNGSFGQGVKRMGESNWLRLTERRTATAKSVFIFES
jgi:hypothetical protein